MSKGEADVVFDDFDVAIEVGQCVSLQALQAYGVNNGFRNYWFRAGKGFSQSGAKDLRFAPSEENFYRIFYRPGERQYYLLEEKGKDSEREDVYSRLDAKTGLALKPAWVISHNNICECDDAPVSLEENTLLECDLEHPEVQTERYLWLSSPCEACGQARVYPLLFCNGGQSHTQKALLEKARAILSEHSGKDFPRIERKLDELYHLHAGQIRIELPKAPFVWF